MHALLLSFRPSGGCFPLLSRYIHAGSNSPSAPRRNECLLYVLQSMTLCELRGVGCRRRRRRRRRQQRRRNEGAIPVRHDRMASGWLDVGAVVGRGGGLSVTIHHSSPWFRRLYEGNGGTPGRARTGRWKSNEQRQIDSGHEYSWLGMFRLSSWERGRERWKQGMIPLTIVGCSTSWIDRRTRPRFISAEWWIPRVVDIT